MPSSKRQSWASYPSPADLPPVVVNDPSLPLVSVVTPSYNQGRYIRHTIESVLMQKYPNIEYWVIDGGSTDETVAILREYEHDPRFHWISEPDQGQSDAINKGWSRCQGQILAWLNSDDVYTHDNVLSEQQRILGEGVGPDLVYANCFYTNREGLQLRAYPTRPFSHYALLRACHVPQPTVFLTRDLVDRVGPLNTKLHYAMDYNYWLRCAEHCAFKYNQTVLATYRLHEESKTVASSVSQAYESAQVVALALGRLQENIEPRLQRNVLSGAFLHVASAYAQDGKLRTALHFASKAFRLDRRDRRWLLFFLTLIDYSTGNKLQLHSKAIDLAHTE